MAEEFEDVTGLEFTVGSVKSGGGSGYKPLDEDEVYEARLSAVVKKEMTFGPALEWVFDLMDPQFTYEYEGKQVQRRVKGTSSMSCTPRSKLYAWYCKLFGKDLEEGEKIQLTTIVGKPCRILVKNTTGTKLSDDGTKTIYSNVAKVLASKGGFEAPEKPDQTEPLEAPTTPTEKKSKAPTKKNVEKPIEKPVEKPTTTVEPPKADSADDDDVFSDIF